MTTEKLDKIQECHKPIDSIENKELFTKEITSLYVFATKNKKLFLSKRKKAEIFRKEFGVRKKLSAIGIILI